MSLRDNRDDERALAELGAIVASSSDAIIGKSLDGVVTSWNAAAERVYGYTADEIVGEPISLLIPTERADELPEILERIGRGESVQTYETVRLRKDGTPIEVALTVSPITRADGAVIGASTIARDITAQKQTERALLRAEESYRLLFERHPQPLFVYERSSRRMLEVNHAALTAYGYARDEFLAMSIVDLIGPSDRTKIEPAMQERNLHPGRAASGVWSHAKKDGDTIYMNVTSSDIDFEGKEARLVLAEDVTERNRLEAQLRQAQKMEAVGNLAGGIAHDFNNILLVIRGHSAALLEEHSEGHLHETVAQIDSAAAQASDFTRQLLAFSRQQVLRPEGIDLNPLVEETLRLLQRMIAEDVAVELDLAPTLAPILIDRGQLAQAMLNLVINARDAMPDGGTVTIRTAEVWLDDTYAASHEGVTAGSYVLLQVTDTGTGIDLETQGRIFDPFFTTKAEGTGLGLATVYGLVKQSNGHIWLYSELDMGTTFKLYFPAAAGATVAKPERGGSERLEGDETILVVEDAEMVRTLVVGVLERYGYTVLSAASGPEALELAEGRKAEIDVLLTDIVMPGMNGRELAEQFVALHPEVKVLFTSGYPADIAIRQGISEAQMAFLEKPYLPVELGRAVRGILDA
jgi:PAS domain S-box-containing protein